MRIGISINEVLRDFLTQLIYTYNKYISELDIKAKDVTNFDLLNFFKFNNQQELNKFLYSEGSLEVFGHADEMSDGLMGYFNKFILELTDNGHYVELTGKEANKSIQSTFFYLTKTGCRISNIRFVIDSTKEWDNLDILITANPDALKNKPNGKISIKINAPYNTDAPADYSFDTFVEFIKDFNKRDIIFNTKITNYEEI
jgi:5'(3')-deoxyribonucleotidase